MTVIKGERVHDRMKSAVVKRSSQFYNKKKVLSNWIQDELNRFEARQLSDVFAIRPNDAEVNSETGEFTASNKLKSQVS